MDVPFPRREIFFLRLHPELVEGQRAKVRSRHASTGSA
jgi:hypothetical protein